MKMVAAGAGVEVNVARERVDEEPPPVLAVTSTVGSPSAPPAPSRKMTMPIPLNEEAAKLLADRNEVTLTLRVAGRSGRGPLKFDRAYFREP